MLLAILKMLEVVARNEKMTCRKYLHRKNWGLHTKNIHTTNVTLGSEVCMAIMKMTRENK